MNQLREFAQHKSDFDQLHVRVVGISVDDQEHAKLVWDKKVDRNFTILSDPGAKVIRQYGLLHAKGYKGEDIALRATLIVDKDGREVFRQVSSSVPDVRHADQILAELKKIP